MPVSATSIREEERGRIPMRRHLVQQVWDPGNPEQTGFCLALQG